MASASSHNRLPQLDGVRGIAILLVVIHNVTGKYPALHLDRVFANGWMGVDLFFVLSGLLITGILLETKESTGFFRNFYARRVLRIWPLYYVTLLFMFVVVPVVHPVDNKALFERASPWWAFPLFVQNFLVQAPEGAPGLLGVTWSLAIEEQFYLVWPLVVRFCSRSLLRWIAVLVVCVSPALRLMLLTAGADIYSNTFARLDGLMTGALLAILMRSPGFVPARFLGTAWMVLAIATPLAFVTEALDARWVVFSLSAAASAALVYLSLYSPQSWVQRALGNRFLVYTGTISYGLYLLHKIPFNVGTALHFDRYPLLAAPILFVAAYGMAVLSWRCLEKPFLDLKRHFLTKPALLLAAPALGQPKLTPADTGSTCSFRARSRRRRSRC